VDARNYRMKMPDEGREQQIRHRQLKAQVEGQVFFAQGARGPRENGVGCQ